MPPFTTDHIPDLSGQTVIITGANSGIGRAAARALAGAGAHVVLAVRDTGKGAQAAASIQGSTEVRLPLRPHWLGNPGASLPHRSSGIRVIFCLRLLRRTRGIS